MRGFFNSSIISTFIILMSIMGFYQSCIYSEPKPQLIFEGTDAECYTYKVGEYSLTKKYKNILAYRKYIYDNDVRVYNDIYVYAKHNMSKDFPNLYKIKQIVRKEMDDNNTFDDIANKNISFSYTVDKISDILEKKYNFPIHIETIRIDNRPYREVMDEYKEQEKQQQQLIK